jgi:hypothetical protein
MTAGAQFGPPDFASSTTVLGLKCVSPRIEPGCCVRHREPQPLWAWVVGLLCRRTTAKARSESLLSPRRRWRGGLGGCSPCRIELALEGSGRRRRRLRRTTVMSALVGSGLMAFAINSACQGRWRDARDTGPLAFLLVLPAVVAAVKLWRERG